MTWGPAEVAEQEARRAVAERDLPPGVSAHHPEVLGVLRARESTGAGPALTDFDRAVLRRQRGETVGKHMTRAEEADARGETELSDEATTPADRAAYEAERATNRAKRKRRSSNPTAKSIERQAERLNKARDATAAAELAEVGAKDATRTIEQKLREIEVKKKEIRDLQKDVKSLRKSVSGLWAKSRAEHAKAKKLAAG